MATPNARSVRMLHVQCHKPFSSRLQVALNEQRDANQNSVELPRFCCRRKSRARWRAAYEGRFFHEVKPGESELRTSSSSGYHPWSVRTPLVGCYSRPDSHADLLLFEDRLLVRSRSLPLLPLTGHNVWWQPSVNGWRSSREEIASGHTGGAATAMRESNRPTRSLGRWR